MDRLLEKTPDHKALETIAVLAFACILFSILLDATVMLYLALGILFTGLFIRPAALLISRWWLKLAAVIGIVNTRIILSVIFFLVLTPLACLRRLFQGDTMDIKKPIQSDRSLWKRRDHLYTREDLEKLW